MKTAMIFLICICSCTAMAQNAGTTAAHVPYTGHVCGSDGLLFGSADKMHTVATLKVGETVSVVGREGDVLKVITAANQEGWMSYLWVCEGTPPLEMSPVADLPHPESQAVAFIPLAKGNEAVAFVVSPSGKIGTLPMHSIAQAYNSGYRPFTVADLLAITNAVADEEKNLQRRTKELSEDYDALAARYNRLAAVSSATPVQPQPAFDERQAMRAMLFRSLLQRAIPAPPVQVQVQTVDCTKFPALCAGH